MTGNVNPIPSSIHFSLFLNKEYISIHRWTSSSLSFDHSTHVIKEENSKTSGVFINICLKRASGFFTKMWTINRWRYWGTSTVAHTKCSINGDWNEEGDQLSSKKNNIMFFASDKITKLFTFTFRKIFSVLYRFTRNVEKNDSWKFRKELTQKEHEAHRKWCNYAGL